jgi:hypothetical protein
MLARDARANGEHWVLPICRQELYLCVDDGGAFIGGIVGTSSFTLHCST